MKEMIAVTQCCGRVSRGGWARFQFRGFYRGVKVKEIWVVLGGPDNEVAFQKGEEYLLHLILLQELDGVLQCRCQCFKSLSEMSF